MRVLKLGVKNFRSYGVNPGSDDGFHWLNLENDIVFLIGQNDAGKSTLLQSYRKLYTSGTKLARSDFHNEGDVPVEICALIEASEEELENDKLAGKFDGNRQAFVKKIWSNVDASAKTAGKHPGAEDWGPFAGFDSILQNRLPFPHFLSGFDGPETLSTILSKMVIGLIKSAVQDTENYKKTVEGLNQLAELIDSDEHLGRISAAVSHSFSAAFPGSQIHITNPPNEDKISSLFEKRINVKVAYPGRGDGAEFPLENVGHGLQRHFILAAIQAVSDEILKASKQQKNIEGELILIEEPELFLHPSKLRDLQNILYEISENTNFQIIAATHSPVLIDLSRDHQTLARIKQSDETGSQIFQIDSSVFDDDERSRLSMINRFNPHVAEAFFADDVLLVEGDTEVTVFRTLIERLKEKADPNLLGIHVINCMGKHTIPAFQKVLNHFNIEYYAIHDLDTEYLDSGKKNPAWSANAKIEAEAEAAKKAGLPVRTFTFDPNFEEAHNYEYKSGDGKVFSAFKEIQGWDLDRTELPAVTFIKQVLQVGTQP